MKGLLVLAIAIGVAAAWAMGEYGTIAPCGILREELIRETTAQQIAEIDENSGFELAGTALAVQIAGPIIDAKFRAMGMSSTHCAEALWRWRVRGEMSPFDPLPRSDFGRVGVPTQRDNEALRRLEESLTDDPSGGDVQATGSGNETSFGDVLEQLESEAGD
ncbi:MAG TPA: hypothetical protein VGA50_08960 [Kiloniellales bacterium]